MLRRLILAVTFVATLAVAGLVTADTSEAQLLLRRRSAANVYYYVNGPEQMFVGPPIRRWTNA
jgi:hypothetical protein